MITRASSSSTTTKDDPRADLQRAHRWIWLSLCLPAFLFLLVAVFGVRSFTGCGLWLGLPLLFTGLFTFVAAVVTWVLPGWLITRNAPGGEVTLEGVAPGVTQALVDVGNSIAHIAAGTVGIVAILLILLGRVCWLPGSCSGWRGAWSCNTFTAEFAESAEKNRIHHGEHREHRVFITISHRQKARHGIFSWLYRLTSPQTDFSVLVAPIIL